MPRREDEDPAEGAHQVDDRVGLAAQGFIVTSGISATAGERKVAMATSATSSRTMKAISGPGAARVTAWAYACRAGTTY
jgi:hypothetical protein